MIERFIACRKFGASIHLTSPTAGVPGMRAYMEQLLRYFFGGKKGKKGVFWDEQKGTWDACLNGAASPAIFCCEKNQGSQEN